MTLNILFCSVKTLTQAKCALERNEDLQAFAKQHSKLGHAQVALLLPPTSPKNPSLEQGFSAWLACENDLR